ncbi:MAG: DUF1854 domain-containing protein, partial [Planctomycetota bacterium]
EATSSIDAEAEREIQRALAALVRGRTKIETAHRLSTLRNADRILGFDRGRLVEQGTHAELLAADGLYARLVRIQTQVSKQPTVDALLAEPPAEPADEPAEPPVAITWLDPLGRRFTLGEHGRIEFWEGESRRAAGVFVVPTFPASHPEEYLSVRGWGDDGEEEELGLVRRLADWPAADAAILRDAVARRILVRTIRRVHDVRLVHGYLDFDVETDTGRDRFTIRWTQSQAVDFGTAGKLLIDTEENRWVVPRIEDLPKAEREKLERYVYW